MQNHPGFTLLEILITLFILSLLLLGLNAMQLTALRKTTAAYYFSVATEQLHSMAERLHATNGSNNMLSQLSWNEQNKEVLPQGVGTINENTSNATLTLFWGKQHAYQCDRTTIGQSGCLQLSATIEGPS